MVMSASNGLPLAVTWGRLQTFLEVIDTGSVRAAADSLHVTPSAVSAAISALEAALDTRLFDKAGRGIVPTDAGITLAGYARTLLGLLSEAAGAVHDADRSALRIGAVTTASEYVLPSLMSSFVAQHPRVELSLSVLPRSELFAAALHHEVDVVLAGRPPRGSGLVSRARRANQLLVVGRAGRTVDLATCTWLLTGLGSGTRDTALALLSRLEADAQLLTLGSTGAVIAAAREGLGVTLAHQEAVQSHLDAGALQTYAAAGTPLDRPWHLSTTAQPTATARMFVEHVCSSDLAGEAAFAAARRR